MLINPDLKKSFVGSPGEALNGFKVPDVVSSKTACLILALKNSSLKRALEAGKVRGTLISRKIRLIDVQSIKEHLEKRTNKKKWVELDNGSLDEFKLSLAMSEKVLGDDFVLPDGYFVLKDFCNKLGISKQGVMKKVLSGNVERISHCGEFVYREAK